MKKGAKFALGTIAALASGWFIYKFFKKELSKIEKEEEADRQAVEAAGVSYERLKREVTPEVIDEGNGLVKSIACFLFSSAPGDLMDVKEAEEADGCIIHVMQSEYKEHPCLDLMFELPAYYRTDNPRLGYPNIGDYIRSIRELTEQINNDIVKGPAPVVKPELYLETVYVNNDEDNLDDRDKVSSSYFLVPREVFASYATDSHDGLVDFYREMYKDPNNNNADHIADGGLKALIDKYGDIVPFSENRYRIQGLRIFIKVSFRVATPKGGYGISLFTAPRVIQQMAEELQVQGSSRNGGRKQTVTFNHILVHPHVFTQEESGEIPCVAYENVKGDIVQQDYLL